MAKRIRLNNDQYVTCAACRHAKIDVDGISRRNSDGEYFMCRCGRGHGCNAMGVQFKLFKDQKRICRDYESIESR